MRGHNEGTVTLHKASKLWTAAVSMPDGKRRTAYCHGRLARSLGIRENNKKAAGKLLAELTKQRDAGLTPRRLTVEALLSGWVDEVIQVRPSTEKHYRQIVDLHLIPALGKVQLTELTPTQVQRYLRKKGETHAPQTVRHHHAVLRNALGYAVTAGYVGRNVAANAKPPAAPARPVATVGRDGLARIAASGDRLVALWLLAGTHGLRESEALGLLWTDVDLDGGVVRIDAQLARADGRWVRVDPKTAASRRTVQLAPFVTAALVDHQRRMLAEAAKAESWPFYRHVFLTPAGRPYHSAKLLDTWYALLTRLELPRVTFHQLRHSAATNALAAGATLEDVKQMLGHSSIRLTSDTYAHPDAGRAREVAEMLGRGFGG